MTQATYFFDSRTQKGRYHILGIIPYSKLDFVSNVKINQDFFYFKEDMFTRQIVNFSFPKWVNIVAIDTKVAVMVKCLADGRFILPLKSAADTDTDCWKKLVSAKKILHR